MKKFLVLALTGLAIVVLTFFGLSRPSYESAPSLGMKSMRNFGGDNDYAEEAYPPAEDRAMPAAPPPSGGTGLGLGTRGGGGYGSGYGALGAKSAPRPMALKKDMKAKGMAMATTAMEPEAEGGEGPGGGEAATRAWFPETFLFEPLVVTDEAGRANVPVKVPDRLTTWRVLALAHSRQGSQAGAVTSFLGTLPAYVDAVTPPFLYAGDVVKLPVQVVNTTEKELAAQLAFSATGASLSSAGGAVRVPAAGDITQFVTVTTTTPGELSFRAQLGSTDAVEKTVELKPQGRREVVSKAGTLAAPRTFTLTGPANALPGTEGVRVKVFPGALGLLRSELSAAPYRGGVAEDAYLLQLLGEAPALLHALGTAPDKETIRNLTILATQRVMRHARAPSVDTATLLAAAALANADNPVLSRVGERLAAQTAAAQRGDGTCQGATGWTLQRLLVTTGDCVRAVQAAQSTPAGKQRATLVRLKAAGAFERNLGRVADGYTAAAILASGAVEGTAVEPLRKLVLDNLEVQDDGAKFLKVEAGTVRADGYAPSTYEATALAILALENVEGAPVADLGAYLLSGYSPYSGWGDGRANLVSLRAAVRLFKDPVPDNVTITLERDGQPLTSGRFDAAALKDVLSLDAPANGSSGAHEWTLRAEPPVPGLGYSLQLVAYVPWKDEPGGGLDLKTVLPTLNAGLPASVALTAAVPGGTPMKLELSLPAGVQPDSDGLTSLVSQGKVTRFETEDGLITLHLPPQANGALWQASVPVVPTLAGTLHAGASVLSTEGWNVRKREFAPLTWKVE